MYKSANAYPLNIVDTLTQITIILGHHIIICRTKHQHWNWRRDS